MAGGVALNCSANGTIKRSELFKRVFVQPAAGDDGTALGAALYVQRLNDPEFQTDADECAFMGARISDRRYSSGTEGPDGLRACWKSNPSASFVKE